MRYHTDAEFLENEASGVQIDSRESSALAMCLPILRPSRIQRIQALVVLYAALPTLLAGIPSLYIRSINGFKVLAKMMTLLTELCRESSRHLWTEGQRSRLLTHVCCTLPESRSSLEPHLILLSRHNIHQANSTDAEAPTSIWQRKLQLSDEDFEVSRNAA